MSQYQKSNPVGYWNDAQADTSDQRAGATAPAFNVISGGIFCTSFQAGRSDTQFHTIQFSHGLLIPSSLDPHIHFAPSINIPIGATVKWQWEYVMVPVGGVVPGVTITMNQTFVNAVAVTPALTALITEFGPFALPAGAGVSTIILQRVTRISSGVGADTFAGDCFLLGVDWHYQTLWPGGTAVEFP